MKTIVALATLLFLSHAQAAVTCTDLQNSEDFTVLRSGDVLDESNWNSIDVILAFDFKECYEAISQELIKVNGEYLWQFRSTEDHCDGGNTYGSIYSYDLKTPIAHIYDGDIYCEDNWRPGQRATNHKCDAEAAKYAAKKMKKLGLKFEAGNTSVDVRRPYAYSYVDISGKVTNHGNTSATVRVLTDLKTCRFLNARVIYLTL